MADESKVKKATHRVRLLVGVRTESDLPLPSQEQVETVLSNVILDTMQKSPGEEYLGVTWEVEAIEAVKAPVDHLANPTEVLADKLVAKLTEPDSAKKLAQAIMDSPVDMIVPMGPGEYQVLLRCKDCGWLGDPPEKDDQDDPVRCGKCKSEQVKVVRVTWEDLPPGEEEPGPDEGVPCGRQGGMP